MDGAPAEAAFQRLVDRGLLSDTPPAQAPQAPQPPAANEPIAAKTPAPEPTAVQVAPETPAAAPAAPAADEDYASLDDYLTKSGIERASFLELPVTVKIDGKESQVPLSALVKSYQTDAYVTQRSQAQAEKERGWQTEQTTARTQLQHQLAAAQQLGQLAQQELMREYQGVTPDDPARYLAAQQRMQAIQQHLSQTQAASQQLALQSLEAERAKMLDAVPEWRDPEKFQEASRSLSSYAASRGLTPAEIAAITDHRHMLIVRDAARAQALQAEVDALKAKLDGKTNAALKIVRAAPPMASPGARVTSDPKVARIQQVREAARAGKLARNEDAQAAAFGVLLDAGA